MSLLSSSRTVARISRMRIEVEMQLHEAGTDMRKHRWPYPNSKRDRYHQLQSQLESLDITYDTAVRSFFQFNNK